MGLTTTKYFRWDDPGALKLDGTAGSFYAIIKHCLTEAGWSVEFDDPGNFKVVLRNSQAHGGSGGYLRVHDDGSFTGGGRVASWQAYESMTDIDTGTLQCCDNWAWKAREAGGAEGADAVRRCYLIVADERTCYISTWVGDNNANPRGVNPSPADNVHWGYSMGWVGDIEPFVAGDPGFGGCFMSDQNPPTFNGACGAHTMLWGAGNNLGQAHASTSFRLSRNDALSPTPVLAMIDSCRGIQSSKDAIGGSSGSVIPVAEPTYYIPAMVYAERRLRGRMRGLYVPLNNLSGAAMPLGSIQTPIKSGQGLQLLTLRGTSADNDGTFNRGFLFVERSLSWDDI